MRLPGFFASRLMLALPLCIIAAFIGCNELQEMHFQSLKEAKSEGMIEKGWIPEFVPPDASDIRVQGDLDSGRVFGSFVTRDPDVIASYCKGEGTVSRDEMPKWFPQDLRSAHESTYLQKMGYEIRSCESGATSVALFPSEEKVFYWITPREQ